MSEGLNFDERQHLIAALRLLGALLRTKPSSSELQPFFRLLGDSDFSQHWPTGTPEELQEIQRKL
ncbi:MAG: hypothetical protein ACRCWR_11270, partial [Saezia sp.]